MKIFTEGKKNDWDKYLHLSFKKWRKKWRKKLKTRRKKKFKKEKRKKSIWVCKYLINLWLYTDKEVFIFFFPRSVMMKKKSVKVSKVF